MGAKPSPGSIWARGVTHGGAKARVGGRISFSGASRNLMVRVSRLVMSVIARKSGDSTNANDCSTTQDRDEQARGVGVIVSLRRLKSLEVPSVKTEADEKAWYQRGLEVGNSHTWARSRRGILVASTGHKPE